MKFSSLIAVTIASCTLSACSKSDDEPKLAAFELKDLVGLWSVGCTPSDLGQVAAYRVAALQITAVGNFIYEDSHYGDEACTDPYYEESSKGALEIGAAVDAYGRRITLTPTVGSGTVKNDAIVTAFNELSACGHKDWVKDQPQDLLDTGCVGWSEINATDGINLDIAADGKRQLQVFSVNANGDKQRYAGDDFAEE